LNRRQFVKAAAFAAGAPLLAVASPAASKEHKWLAIAESLEPRIYTTPVTPTGIVQMAADPAQFLHWRAERVAPPEALSERLLRRGDSVIVDFGRHLTGTFFFSISGEGRGVDAPARLKLTFGEVPSEVAQPFDPYKGGLGRAWLQDEVFNLDVLPANVEMPRRYAFRYVKLEVVDTSPNYAVRIGKLLAAAASSAGDDPAPLPESVPALLRQIDRVSIATLRDCMQTVFEDGPKRDRRLWIGDLRLQALTNYATFRNNHLVKRCLYLFAAFPREDGLLPACVFEAPQPHRGHEYIIDYAALYAAAVLDYAKATTDWKTAVDLWPVVRKQMDLLSAYVGSDGIFAAPARSWVFVDWSDALDRAAAMQGVFVYALRQALELARHCGASGEAAKYQQLIARMTTAARGAFYDSSRRVFVSGPKRQVSWASQAWMALSGIATAAEAAQALRNATTQTDAVRPGAPYLYHYVAEAMLGCGMKLEARQLVETYWGGMVKAGADTFWEVYDPSNSDLSPYGSVLVNSYCHAWSCTPAYLLRSLNLAGK
jgi:alpha-L-rhamnosidase